MKYNKIAFTIVLKLLKPNATKQLMAVYLLPPSPNFVWIKGKNIARSEVSKPMTSHCCRVSLATFLPTLLTSLPSSLLREVCNSPLQ